MRRGAAIRLILVLVLALAWPGLVVSSQDETPITEDAIKAAFLYRFGGFVDWPDGTFNTDDAEFTVGVVTAPEIATHLENIVRERRIGGRRVIVRRLGAGESIDDVHVLFVGRGAPTDATAWLDRITDRPVLVVTEADADLALDAGSAINFVVVENRVRFDVAPDEAARRGLRISANLLAVARRVVGPR